MSEPSLWSFISNASPVVKFVMLILLLASITSWTIILQRVMYFKQLRKAARLFEDYFWSGTNLSKLYDESSNQSNAFGLERIFLAGFKDFQRNRASTGLDSTQRAMRVATTQETTRLEKHLGFLATVGSTSPYVGLFGTVWGIMSAFRALGVANQATIAMVAPGIAEALIATAIGLFAAIPAVIAYNRLSNSADHIATTYETFQEELTTLFDHHAKKEEITA